MLTTDFPITSLYFACPLTLVASTTITLNIYLKLNKIWITHRPASKSVIMAKLPGDSWSVVFVLRTKLFLNTILKHHLWTMFTKTVHITKTELFSNTFLKHHLWTMFTKTVHITKTGFRRHLLAKTLNTIWAHILNLQGS